MRRVHLRGKNNIAKRALIHAAAFNLSLILRQMLGVGTARQAADLFAALCFAFLKLTQAANSILLAIEPRRPRPDRQTCLVTINHRSTRKRLYPRAASVLS